MFKECFNVAENLSRNVQINGEMKINRIVAELRAKAVRHDNILYSG